MGNVVDDLLRLVPRLSAALDSAHAEIVSFRSKVGFIGNREALTTEAKDTLVAAINEVNAKPSGGGGGAAIDDESTDPAKVWSSAKVSQALESKVSSPIMLWADPANGFEGIPLDIVITSMSATMGNALSFDPDSTVRPRSRIMIVDEMPEFPNPGDLYGIRASDGTVTWQIP